MCFTENSGTGKQYGVLLCIGQTDGSLQKTVREIAVGLLRAEKRWHQWWNIVSTIVVQTL